MYPELLAANLFFYGRENNDVDHVDSLFSFAEEDLDDQLEVTYADDVLNRFLALVLISEVVC